MLETKKPLISSSGFYVRMRLPHNARNNRNLHKSFCYRCFKWILWFSICFYFFSSFLITSNKPTPSLSKTTLSHFREARALIEEQPLDSSAALLHHLKNPGDANIFKGMKVYVYDLPSKYNRDWLSNERCSSHLFAAEVAIHRALMSSEVRTLDPWRLTSSSSLFTSHAISAKSMASPPSATPALSWRPPSAIFRLTFRFGTAAVVLTMFLSPPMILVLAFTMEDMAMADGVPEFLRNSIILQTFGVKHEHPCQDVENVVIPPYVSPESVRATLEKSPLDGRREIFAFFRGKMEVHPKNISGRFYSKRVRTTIWRRYGNDRRFYLKRHRFAGYQSEIVRSKFCLCPTGWAPWSPRLVESVALGCVPVIIADGIRLPFPSAVPWAAISLTVAEKDVDQLGKILEHVAATNLTSIQRNLWDPEVRKALLFYDPMLEGDATWQVLVALSGKLDRSHKQPRVSVQ
ncbi:UNVERIFIED_CONTAM: putative glucuronoxylan glucuronosyltransferase IRX7 [Sesamum radiatum]|uniref:Glucuronoxylan glucuronosyltransferase IRX7 n=1 Tax=Sesamum radiatum TaxID=300843 RepID=A0AAW2W8B4_SESRA